MVRDLRVLIIILVVVAGASAVSMRPSTRPNPARPSPTARAGLEKVFFSVAVFAQGIDAVIYPSGSGEVVVLRNDFRQKRRMPAAWHDRNLRRLAAIGLEPGPSDFTVDGRECTIWITPFSPYGRTCVYGVRYPAATSEERAALTWLRAEFDRFLPKDSRAPTVSVAEEVASSTAMDRYDDGPGASAIGELRKNADVWEAADALFHSRYDP